MASFRISLSLILSFSALISGKTEFQMDQAVEKLAEFLRIDSSHPTPDYDRCISWINETYGSDFELHYESIPGPENLFAFWLTWNGTDPSLKSILINTHIDVVAADEAKWEPHPPFGGIVDRGWIYGRGAIDMKSATVGALEALRRLKQEGFNPLRTIRLTFMPDEEIGGHHGMQPFLESETFKSFNVGVDIDECEINDGPVLKISNAEKAIWQFTVTANGQSAHASTLPKETATGRLQFVVNKLLQFRQEQIDLIEESNSSITYNDVTTINLTKLGGGLANNIIPADLWAVFDMRILPKPNEGWNFTDVENFLNDIIAEAGPEVNLTFIQQWTGAGVTDINGNVWWDEILRVCNETLNIPCEPQTISGATDGRYVRAKGIPVFGIHPILNTPKLQHQDNEKIPVDEFLQGITRYTEFIRGLASLPEGEHDS